MAVPNGAHQLHIGVVAMIITDEVRAMREQRAATKAAETRRLEMEERAKFRDPENIKRIVEAIRQKVIADFDARGTVDYVRILDSSITTGVEHDPTCARMILEAVHREDPEAFWVVIEGWRNELAISFDPPLR